MENDAKEYESIHELDIMAESELCMWLFLKFGLCYMEVNGVTLVSPLLLSACHLLSIIAYNKACYNVPMCFDVLSCLTR